jgi:membrane-associated phospholipid phosphatase
LLSQNTLAKAISAVFNAPIVALYAFAIIILLRQPASSPLLLFVSWFFSGIVPILTILLMMKKGIIHDVYASERSTRLKPFLAATASYACGVLVLLIMGAPTYVTALMGCYLVNTVVMMTITLKWKISIHASGVAGPSTFLVFLFGALWAPILLLMVPVGWARIHLGAHTFNQVAAGFLLTILLTWLQLMIYLR